MENQALMNGIAETIGVAQIVAEWQKAVLGESRNRDTLWHDAFSQATGTTCLDTVLEWKKAVLEELRNREAWWHGAVSRATGTTDLNAWGMVMIYWKDMYRRFPELKRESKEATAVWEITDVVLRTILSLDEATSLDDLLCELDEATDTAFQEVYDNAWDAAQIAAFEESQVEAFESEEKEEEFVKEMAEQFVAEVLRPDERASWSEAMNGIRESLSDEALNRGRWDDGYHWYLNTAGSTAVSYIKAGLLTQWDDDEKRSLNLDEKLERVAMRTLDNNTIAKYLENSIRELRGAFESMSSSVKTKTMESTLESLESHFHEGEHYFDWYACVEDMKSVMRDCRSVVEGSH